MYYYEIGYCEMEDSGHYDIAHIEEFSRKDLICFVNEAKEAIEDELKVLIDDYIISPSDYFAFEDCNIKKWLCENKGFIDQSPITACYLLS